MLRLQDEHGLNVNLVLWCLWCGAYFDDAPEYVVRKAADLTQKWNCEVTARLRAARRALKSAPPDAAGVASKDALALAVEALRERVKADELASERIEQDMLETMTHGALTPASGPSGAPARARRALAAYARLAGAAKTPGFTIAILENLIENTLS